MLWVIMRISRQLPTLYQLHLKFTVISCGLKLGLIRDLWGPLRGTEAIFVISKLQLAVIEVIDQERLPYVNLVVTDIRVSCRHY